MEAKCISEIMVTISGLHGVISQQVVFFRYNLCSSLKAADHIPYPKKIFCDISKEKKSKESSLGQ
jgi:hypothetical protein